MKIRYFSKVIGFLSYLRSKIAHQTYQFRDSLHMERKNQIFKEIWFYLNEKFFALKIISFFTLFALSNPSINTKQDGQQKERNPSPCTNPYFAKIFFKVGKIEFQFPAVFRPIWAFNLALEVPSNRSILLHQAQVAQNVPSSSHQFGKLTKFDFPFPCVINCVCVFECIQDIK